MQWTPAGQVLRAQLVDVVAQDRLYVDLVGIGRRRLCRHVDGSGGNGGVAGNACLGGDMGADDERIAPNLCR